MIPKVAFPDGWERPCTALKIPWRCPSGTRIRGRPNDTSHTIVRLTPGNCRSFSLKEVSSSSLIGRCSRANFSRSTSANVCTTECTIAVWAVSSYCLESASATTFSTPGTWVISVTNSLRKANCLLCRSDTGSLALKKADVRGFWSVKKPYSPSLKHVPKLNHCAVQR